jgi:integrase
MKGNITRRGTSSWRLKFDLGRDPVTRKRLSRFVTVRGTKKAAQAELARLLAAHDAGTLVEPSKATLADYLRSWIDTAAALKLSPKTAERYCQLIERQIVPHLGVFGNVEGALRDPDRITQDWKRFAAKHGLPRVTLHALRHAHASALIAAGADPVTVSRRLGHSSPLVTMAVYAHLFDRSDEAAAKAIDAVLSIAD